MSRVEATPTPPARVVSPKSSPSTTPPLIFMDETRRLNSVKETFGVDTEERLVAEFSAAVLKSILLHGRLYVFEKRLGFYSSIFGVKTKLLLPFSDITSIKRHDAALPAGAIKVIYKGKPFVFASFLFVDSALKKIQTAWSVASPYARLQLGEDYDEIMKLCEEEREEKEKEATTRRRRTEPIAIGQGHAAVEEVRDEATTRESRPPGSNRRGVTVTEGMRLPQQSESETDSDPQTDKEAAEAPPEAQRRRNATVAAIPQGEIEYAEATPPLPSADVYLSSTLSGEEEERESSGRDTSEIGKKKDLRRSKSAAGLLGTCQAPMETLFEVDIHDSTLDEIFRLCFSDELGGSFINTWRENRGDTDISVGPWSLFQAPRCMMREVSFTSETKASWGPKKTRVHETQRYCLMSEEGDGEKELIVESSQVMLDVPFGDTFSLHNRLLFNEVDTGTTATPAPTVHFVNQFRVEFSKRTLWSGKIEQVTKERMIAAQESFTSAIVDAVSRLRPPSSKESETKKEEMTPRSSADALDVESIMSFLKGDDMDAMHKDAIKAMLNIGSFPRNDSLKNEKNGLQRSTVGDRISKFFSINVRYVLRSATSNLVQWALIFVVIITLLFFFFENQRSLAEIRELKNVIGILSDELKSNQDHRDL